MGYEKASEDILVLKQQSSSYDSLVYVACECFLAAVECFIMTQIWEKVDENKYAILDVYRSRMEVCGDVEQCSTWVVQHCVPQRRPVPAEPRTHNYNSFNSYHHHYIRSSSSGAKPKVNAHYSTTNSNSVTDHHSNNESGKSKKSSRGTASPTLTKKSRESKDSGHGSKSTSKELPDIAPGRLKSEEIAPEDLYGQGKQACDNSIAQLSMEKHELYLRDSRTGVKLQTDSGAGSDSADDLYVAKSMDDHLKQSEKYLKETEQKPGASGPPSAPGGGGGAGSGAYDEWSDVRDKLRQDFGDKYFEGERGDTILKPPQGGAIAPPGSSLREQQDKDRKKSDRKSFQNVDVVRGDLSSARQKPKVEFGPADKYKGPMAAVAERAKLQQTVNDKPTVPTSMEKRAEGDKETKPIFLKQNSAEEQKRFDNAAMVKNIMEQSSVFKKLAAERSPSEESPTKEKESVKSKDVSPTESVHSTVGELIDFSEAKVLHQMGCKFMPELRARPQGKPQLTPEEKAERKKRKEERRKERERREKEKEEKAEAAGAEKEDETTPVKEVTKPEEPPPEKKADAPAKSAKGPAPAIPPRSDLPAPATSANTPSTSAPAKTTEATTSAASTAPLEKKTEEPPSVPECGEHGCEKKSAKPPIVKKEILSSDVISGASVNAQGGSGGSVQPQSKEQQPGAPAVNGTVGVERGAMMQAMGPVNAGPGPGGPGGSPIHIAGVTKGTCIAGHAALTNSTISSHAMGSHSPRCPVHGTPGIPHPLIAINHPHIPQGHHIVMCTAGHAHIAPAHMAAMSQPPLMPSGPKEVPCPKPPPPPVAPKPSGKAGDRRSLDILASMSSRQPPTPPPRVSSALSDGAGGSLSELPPPPPELLSDIHAPPPDLVSNHTPPPSHVRSPSHSSPAHSGASNAPKAIISAVGMPLPAEPPSYEAATGISPGSRRDGPFLAMDDADGLYVVADGPPMRPMTWQCKMCTFANDASKKICEMCHKSKVAGPEAQPLLSGGSQCPRCTYVNSIGSLMCKVCMQDLQGSPTYI